jgi:predicted transcriptional regulator
MSNESEGIQILLNLGLSYSQAKIWLTLVRLGEANITQITKNARVDRAEGSRTIQKLQKSGLVDEVVDVPRRYKALSVKEGVSVLLHTKEQEYQTLVKDSEFFTNRQEEPVIDIEENNRLRATSGKIRNNKYLSQSLAKVEKSTDLCGDWSGFRRMINNSAYDIPRLRKKGIPFRIILEQPNSRHAMFEIEKFSLKNSNVELRFFKSSQTMLFLWIFDRTEIAFSVMPALDWAQARDLSNKNHPALFSSNADALLCLGQTYFEHIWVDAILLESMVAK